MQFYTNVNQWGKNLLVREIVDGKERRRKVKYAPSLFIPSHDGDYQGMFGEKLSKINFEDMKEAKDFMNRYEDVENFDIFGFQKFPISWLQEEYQEEIEYDPKLIRTFIIDIEVYISGGVPDPEKCVDPITSITLYDSYKDVFLVFGTKEYEKHMDNVVYVKCSNEVTLLRNFLYYWTRNFPHVITGWNLEGFDTPYLSNRILNLLGEEALKSLSPWKIFKNKNVYAFGKRIPSFEFVGVAEIDYLPLYKKYVLKPRESYSLDYISYVELGKQKVDYSEEEGLNSLYDNNHQKFIEYNIRDVDLVKQLEERLKLLTLTFEISYYAKINYQDSLSPVKTWDAICCDYLFKEGVIPPPNKSGTKLSYTGGFVKEPKLGYSNWVASVDLNSLYPHIIQQGNLGVETLIPKENIHEDLSWINIENLLEKKHDLSWLKEKDWTVTPNAQVFRIDKKSIFNILMEQMYKTRKANKNKMIELKTDKENGNAYEGIENDITMYDVKQNGQKVLMNALYGASGNEYFRFYDIRIASAITTYAQLVIRWALQKIDEFMNEWLGTENEVYVIYCDTDSAYIEMDDLIRQKFDDPWEDPQKTIDYLDELVSSKIEPKIIEFYEELADYMNAYAQRMSMKREILSDRALWTAKKRYIMNVYDDEGVRYTDPDLKIVGMDAIRSVHSEIVRNKLKEAYYIILNKDNNELKKLVEDFKEEFYSRKPEEIAFPSGVTEIHKWEDSAKRYKSGTPQHVKAVINYNNELKKHKAQEKYSPIFENDKIKYIFLKKANPTITNVIAFNTLIPPEFELEEYIDYDMQWKKTFIEPLCTVLNIIGWDYEDKPSLENLFI